MPALVSCIITTYNRPEDCLNALKSVLEQSYENIEAIVVDDCSDKDISDALDGFDDDRIRFFRHSENRGLASARNTGIAESKGDYIAFLDDDDIWHKDKIEKQLKVFEKSEFENLGMVYCGIRRISDDGRTDFLPEKGLRGDIIHRMVGMQALCGNGSSVLIKKEVFDETGVFDETMRRGIDGDIFTKIARVFEIDYADEILVDYDETGSDRITGFQNEKKIKEAVDGLYKRYEKVSDIIGKYPFQEAFLNFQIAKFHIALKDYKKAREHLLKSVKLDFSVKKAVVFVALIFIPSVLNKKVLKRLRS